MVGRSDASGRIGVSISGVRERTLRVRAALPPAGGSEAFIVAEINTMHSTINLVLRRVIVYGSNTVPVRGRSCDRLVITDQTITLKLPSLRNHLNYPQATSRSGRPTGMNLSTEYWVGSGADNHLSFGKVYS